MTRFTVNGQAVHDRPDPATTPPRPGFGAQRRGGAEMFAARRSRFDPSGGGEMGTPAARGTVSATPRPCANNTVAQ
ncbi:hypothetical protein [Sphingomonas profundi]|uniref:hypothetical protein n=1 Tax=Alterirhizorhabdus profundi TaxID=2681549 RepID=UPI0012E8F258|nr:hypothetical protein [Sphingomonas profundi]